MSLINKMLDELEKAKKGINPIIKEDLLGIIPSIRKQKNSLIWKIAYWVIIAFIISIFAWHYHTRIITKVTKTAVTLQKNFSLKKPQKTPPAAIAPMPTVKLQNIILEQKNNLTILDFILTAPTQYYVEHSSEQQLFITLENAGLLGNLPVSLENTFILNFNTKQGSNNIISTIALLPGTKIDELQLIATPTPHLHIVFSNQQLTNSSMIKIAAPISLEQQEAERYQEIQQLLAQNKIEQVISKLHMFIGDFPDNLQAREMLVSLLIKNEQFKKANGVLMVGLNKSQGYPPFVKLKAYILVKENNPSAAIELLQKYLSSTDDVEYLSLLASLYQQEGYFMNAATIYNQLTKMQPQKAAWWLGIGIALESSGKKNGAREAYERASNSSDIPLELREFLNERIKK